MPRLYFPFYSIFCVLFLSQNSFGYEFIDQKGISYLQQTNSNKKNVNRRASSTRCKSAQQYREQITKSSQKHGIDSKLIEAVIATESCFNAHARSPKGAQGLMQLMPPTAKRFGVTDPYDTSQNIDAGTRYIKILLNRYNYSLKLALAAYNSGEGTVDHYKGIPPYPETIAYVKKVMNWYKEHSNKPVNLLGKEKKVQRQIVKTKSTCIASKKIRQLTYISISEDYFHRYYITKENDSLENISRKTGTPKSVLNGLNFKLKHRNLILGESVLIWSCHQKPSV